MGVEGEGKAGSGSWALVTGASGGIGLELARLLAAEGSSVILVARSGARLEEVAGELRERHGVRTRVEALDLADPDGPERLARSLEDAGIRPRTLVNNAGFGDFGPFHEAPAGRLEGMVALNVAALTRLTRRFLPGMVRAGDGRVLNVASTAAFQPGPLMAVYYATKAYVLSLSEALAEELRDTGVTVTCLCPGPTDTGFQARAEMEDSGLLRLGLSDARSVARRGLSGLERGERVVVPGLMNRLGALLVRFTPRRLVTRIVREIQKPVG